MSAKLSIHASVRSVKITASDSSEKPKLRSARHSRYAQYARSSQFPRGQGGTDFHIRKSLAEYVQKTLNQMGRTLFYQRIHIFAKNKAIEMEAPATEEIVAKASPAIEDTAMVSAEPAEVAEEAETITAEPATADTESTVKEADKGATAQYFFKKFRKHLEDLFSDIDTNSFCDAILTGLLLCMGDYSYLMVEGVEDSVGTFCRKFSESATDWWTINRIFMIEDNIGETWFNTFIFCRAIPININEKFQAATPNDIELMEQQHLIIKDKLTKICETLVEDIKDSDEAEIDELLAPEQYNKLLPEIQRIDLVFNSTRFYRDIQQFQEIYRIVRTSADEDSFVWPTSSNYTPSHVFVRSPYDVNLTFADYGKEDVKSKGENSEDASEGTEGTEGAEKKDA